MVRAMSAMGVIGVRPATPIYKGGVVIHRGFTIIAIVATTALAGGLVASAGAKGHSNECNKSYSNTTFHGGVVVKKGDSCTLNNVVVDGGLTVTGGKFKVDNSLIHGGWTITGGTGIGRRPVQCGNNVDGGLRVMHTKGGKFNFGETNRHCAGGRVNGGVRLVHNRGVNLDVDRYRIYGPLVDTHNSGKWNEVEGTTVHGPATCGHNNFVHGGKTALNDEGGPNTYIAKNRGCPA
jgi:hypothetical protein